MNLDRCDAWTITVATIASRRAALRAFAAGSLAAALGAVRVRRAPAATDAHEKCSRDGECDTGICYKTGKCKQNGKLTGACRCSCDDHPDCPGGKVCCDLGASVKICRAAPGDACRFDTDCCFTLCRQGKCCRAVGGSCGVDSNCCSGNCSGAVCV